MYVCVYSKIDLFGLFFMSFVLVFFCFSCSFVAACCLWFSHFHSILMFCSFYFFFIFHRFFPSLFSQPFFSFLLTMFSSVDLQFSSICSLDFLSPHAKPYLFGMKSMLSSKRCCHKTHLNDRWFWWCQSVILGVRLLLNEPSETHQLWSENRFAETILRLI